MPIRNKRSTLVNDPRLLEPVLDPAFARGELIVSTFTVANLIDDDSGSTFHLIDLPADCMLHWATSFQVQNWGYADVRIGTRSTPGALVSVLRSAANVQTPLAVFDSRWNQMLWQQLGLAANPGGNISLFAHAIANATVAGSMLCNIQYLVR